MQTLTMTDVLDSRTYVRPNTEISFGSPRQLITPFLEVFGNIDQTVVKVQSPITNENDDGSLNIAYPRVVVEKTIESIVPDFNSVIGMIYALDTQVPVIKIYSGHNAHACTNLTIFNSGAVFEKTLLNGYQAVYKVANDYLEQKEEEEEEFQIVHSRLLNTFINQEELQRELGRLLQYAIRTPRFGVQMVTGGAKNLTDHKSRYYVPPGEVCSKMQMYDAFTQVVTDSGDLLSKPNKTIEVARLIAGI